MRDLMLKYHVQEVGMESTSMFQGAGLRELCPIGAHTAVVAVRPTHLRP